jgi:hypothetical protein
MTRKFMNYFQLGGMMMMKYKVLRSVFLNNWPEDNESDLKHPYFNL